jgi:type II secretory pathway component GspD/PulD (secretin)
MTTFGVRRGSRLAILLVGLVAAALIAPFGCRTAKPGEPAKASSKEKSALPSEPALMLKARTERDLGRYNEALLALAEQSRIKVGTPGLEELRTSILDRMVTKREKDLKPAIPVHEDKMVQEVNDNRLLPDSYRAKRIVAAPQSVIRTPDNKAEGMLSLPVSLTLEGADLNVFIMSLTQSAAPSKAINIIADDAISAGGKLSMSVTNVPLREVLDYASRNLDVSFYVGENMIWVTKRTASVDPVPMQTRLYKLRKGISSIEKAGDDGSGIALMSAIEKFVPRDVGTDMMFDRDTHVLIAKNTRENLRLIEDLIEALDVTPPQVLIEARFISTSISDLRELGVNWTSDSIEFKSDGHNNPQAVLKGGKIFQPGQVATPTLDATLAYHGLLSTPMFEVMITALEKSGKAQTLSVPRVTTLNNQPARIRIGEDFLYFEDFELQEVANGQSDSGQNQYVSQLVPVGTPTKEELGILLEVTPSVGADHQTVTLNLKPEISEFVRFEYYNVGSDTGGNNNNNATSNALSVLKLPIFRRSEIETKVAVRSGDTVVMGGLITSSTGREQRKVPFLGSIPFLGVLFRYETKTNDQKNLLIFVTARILAESGEELVPLTPAEMPLAAN